MARIRVNTELYLQELLKEYTELDMNDEPEVEHIEDPTERFDRAKGWLNSRMTQLTYAQNMALNELKKAVGAGYLEVSGFEEARVKYENMFDTLRKQAADKVDHVVGLAAKV